MQVRFLGHAAFELEHDGVRVLLDPFISANPKSPVSADELQADAILLTHGHVDHLGDTVAIAKRTGAPVLAIVELATELADDGLDARGANLGGTVSFPWGSAKLVPAWHTSTSPQGTVSTAAGLVIEFGGQTIYHLGDTCLFSDLVLVARRHPIDLALVCIGGHYTMDRWDAVEAVRLIGPRQVIPCHYDTFEAIETDAAAFKSDVELETASDVILLAPGESHSP